MAYGGEGLHGVAQRLALEGDKLALRLNALPFTVNPGEFSRMTRGLARLAAINLADLVKLRVTNDTLFTSIPVDKTP